MCRSSVTPNMLEQWLALMVTFIVGLHPGKIVKRVMKINASTRGLGERLCDIKIYEILVLNFIGSVCAPDKATLKAENHALQCTTAGPYNAISSKLLAVGSVCGLGLDVVGINSISLAAHYPVAECLSTLRRGPEKSQWGMRAIALLCLLFLLLGNMSFFFRPWLHTANAFDIVCQLDRGDTLDEVPKNKKHKVATGLLLDKLHKLEFAGPLASRASRVLRTDQSSSCCWHPAPHEKCLACCSPAVTCWLPSHPL